MWIEYTVDDGVSVRPPYRYTDHQIGQSEEEWRRVGWLIVLWTDDIRIVQSKRGTGIDRLVIYVRQK